MIAFALLVAPLPMVAASLYADANKLHSIQRKDEPIASTSVADEHGVNLRSWKWFNAAKKVFVLHLWGSVVLLLPYLVCQIPNCSPKLSFLLWGLLSVISLLIMHLILASPFSHASASQLHVGEWAILKSVTISVAFIGLCLMSVINFATAEIGGLLVVPMCLMAHPLKLDLRIWRLRNFLRVAFNLVFVFLGFPPATFMVLKGAFEGFNSLNVGDFWNWVESLWAWNSATYVYIGMVHLTCWVLCIQILFHHC